MSLPLNDMTEVLPEPGKNAMISSICSIAQIWFMLDILIFNSKKRFKNSIIKELHTFSITNEREVPEKETESGSQNYWGENVAHNLSVAEI